MTTDVIPRVEALVVPCLDDPEFEGGSTHIATVQLTNPTTKEFSYTVTLYLGLVAVVSSQGVVTIPAGGVAFPQFSIVMPTTEGVYPVFLDVDVEGVNIEHYQAADITIAVSPAIDIGDITWG